MKHLSTLFRFIVSSYTTKAFLGLLVIISATQVEAQTSLSLSKYVWTSSDDKTSLVLSKYSSTSVWNSGSETKNYKSMVLVGKLNSISVPAYTDYTLTFKGQMQAQKTGSGGSAALKIWMQKGNQGSDHTISYNNKITTSGSYNTTNSCNTNINITYSFPNISFSNKSGSTSSTKSLTEEYLLCASIDNATLIASYLSINSSNTKITYTISGTNYIYYEPNGGTGSEVTQTKTHGTSFTLKNNSTFTRTGYTLSKWSTATSGGTTYTPNTSCTAFNSTGTKLYAQWTANTYTVTYNANGGSFSTTPATKTVTYDATYGTLASAPTRTGYTFAGWYTAASGGTQVTASTKVTITANQTLYAHWTAYTYSVIYDGNGADSGSMSNSSHTYGTSKSLTANTYSKTDCTFLGWSTSSSATEATYTDKQSVNNLTSTNNGTVTLYAVWRSNEYSGACGEHATYNYDRVTGILTISGTGDMYNYTNSIATAAPWYGWRSEISQINIAEEITSIGSYAFYGCNAITSITIPSSVESIGSFAFNGCSELATVKLGTNASSAPCSITSIGSAAFASCGNITKVYCYGGVDKWLNISFTASTSNPGYLATAVLYIDSNKLISLKVPEDATTVNAYAFYNNKELKTVTLPATVTSLGTYAFYGCENISSITIANESNVVELGSSLALSYVPRTAMLTVPGAQYAAYKAANYWKEFTNYVATGSCGASLNYTFTASTGELAFSGSGVMTDYTTSTSMPWNSFKTEITSLKWGNNQSGIGNRAFYGCTGLTGEITIPKQITSLGTYAFYGCTGITTFRIDGLSAITTIPANILQGCTGLTTFYVPSSVTAINAGALSGCAALSQIYASPATAPIAQSNTFTSVPYSCKVQVISEDAKANYIAASYWKNFTYDVYSLAGSSWTYGPGGAKWLKMTYQSLDNENKTIYTTASKGTGINSLAEADRNVTFNANLVVTSGIMQGYSIKIKEIEADGFKDCTILTGITIPNGTIAKIGNNAFKGCVGITTASIGASVAQIGSRAFEGCTALNKLTLTEGITRIDQYAFQDCSALTTVTIPSTVTTLTASVPASGTSTGVFSGCTNLQTVNWNVIRLTSDYGKSSSDGKSFTYATPWGNAKSHVTTINFGSKVEVIPSNLCYGMTSLTSVTIPANITAIHTDAFTGCTYLATVTSKAATPPSLSSAFGNAANATLNVPCGSGAEYDADANWSAFGTIQTSCSTKTVTPGNTLVIDENATYPTLTLNANSELIVKEDATLTVTNLVFQYNNDDEVAAANIAGTLNAQNINLKMNITSADWHNLALPFDYATSEVKIDNNPATLDGDYYLRDWDGEAMSRGQQGWKDIDAPYETMLAHHAYQIGIANKHAGSHTLTFTFNDISWDKAAGSVSVNAFNNGGAGNSINHGWNYVGQPYLSGYNAGESISTGSKAVRVVSIPIRAGYDGYEQVALSETQLKPFLGYFFQVAENGNMSYAVAKKYPSAVAAAPARATAEKDMNTIELILQNESTESDRTTVLLSEDYAADYEIGDDCVKLLGDGYHTLTKPVVYTLTNHGNMAFNALPYTEAQIIPVGYYAATQGEYQFSLNPNRDMSGLEAVWLYDSEEDTRTDLLTGSYAFTSSRQANNNDRFVLSVVQRIQNTPTGYNPAVVSQPAARKIICEGKLYIVREGKMYNVHGNQLK